MGKISMKHMTTKRVLLFLLLLIKLAIFPHIGILFIVAAANASEPYRLEIIHETPSKLNRVVNNPSVFYRSVCGMPKALEWAQEKHFKGVTWEPVAQYPEMRDKMTRSGTCDSRVVAWNEPTLDGEKHIEIGTGENSDRMCTRISGCAINLDAVTEEDYCPTCVWRENRLN
jgi:hypothetical protein